MALEERELILKCQSKDLKAFEKLISQYENKIYNLCFYILKNREDALDASQETCIKIYKSINNFKGNSKISTWIYRVTYNTCMDYFKKKRENFISYEEAAIFEDADNKVEVIIERIELKNAVKKCIFKLTEDYRTIIILRDINGLSYQEIAEILNLELGTVKSRISRARESLKNELIKSGIQGGC